MRYTITIDGMGCAHCVKSVTEALTALNAKVERCEIGSAVIEYDGDMTAVSEAIGDRGFDVISVQEA